MNNARALVLAGGGVAGIAWELGVIDTLRGAGVDVTSPDLIVGTSAGASVGGQISTGQLDAALAMQERAETAEISVQADLVAFMEQLDGIHAAATDDLDVGRRLGAMARAASTPPYAARQAAVAARLPVDEWPQQPLWITAIDADSGARTVFSRSSGVTLAEAAMASGAVPGVWPPSELDGRSYIDGGSISDTNADLAAGYERVLVLIPVVLNGQWAAKLEAELAQLGQVFVVQADDAAMAAIGPNPLDPAGRAPALAAGRRQGAAVADEVAKFWL